MLAISSMHTSLRKVPPFMWVLVSKESGYKGILQWKENSNIEQIQSLKERMCWVLINITHFIGKAMVYCRHVAAGAGGMGAMPPKWKTDMNLPPVDYWQHNFCYVPVSCIKFLPPTRWRERKILPPPQVKVSSYVAGVLTPSFLSPLTDTTSTFNIEGKITWNSKCCLILM